MPLIELYILLIAFGDIFVKFDSFKYLFSIKEISFLTYTNWELKLVILTEVYHIKNIKNNAPNKCDQIFTVSLWQIKRLLNILEYVFVFIR